jgi:AmmeMemoRadiSam system protein A
MKRDKEMLTQKEKKVLLDIVNQAVRVAIEEGSKETAVSKDALTESLRQKKGVFVAIYNGNILRGCIGIVLGVLPLWQACMECARGAAVKDSRFSPISRDELSSLSFEITIISATRMLDDLSSLRPGREGLILKKGFRQDVFLPASISNLIKDGESTFDLLKAKAEIDPEDNSPEVWEVFEAEVISDKR